MKTLTFDTLSILPGVVLLAAVLVAVLPAQLVRLVGVLTGLGTLLLGGWTTAKALDRGGFADQAAGGYVGVRLVDRIELVGSSLGLTLDPLLVLPVLAVAVVGGLATVGVALRGGTRGAVAASLTTTGLLLGQLLLDGLVSVAVCFSLVGVVATLAPLSVLGARPAGAAALRAFALQRVGDGALVLGLAAVAASLGGLSPEALLVAPLDVDPWARISGGGLFGGLPHRTLWFEGAIGVAVAAATRLGILCWPLLRDVTASPDLPPPVVGLVHLAWAASAAGLLLRAHVVMGLAPEAGDGFMWAAAASALIAGALACAGRDLLRIDVHLLVGAALPLVVLSALGSAPGVVLAGAVLMGAALVLPWVLADVVAERGERDPRALGGLEFIIPRLHTSRLLVTATIALMPPFAGWVVFERAAEEALLSSRVPGVLFGLIAVAAVVVGAGAWRVLHLVFSGPKAAVPPSTSPVSPVLPALLLALVLPALALLDLPVHLLRLLPLEIDYDGPLRTLTSPSVAELAPVMTLLRAKLVASPITPRDFVLVVMGLGLVPWLVSLLLWRSWAGGGRPPAGGLLGRRVVVAGADRLATFAGRESPLARTVSEGAERLSRVLATNLIPVALGLLLQQVPGVLASGVGFLLRQLQTGGAQRALILGTVAIALLVWFGQGRP